MFGNPFVVDRAQHRIDCVGQMLPRLAGGFIVQLDQPLPEFGHTARFSLQFPASLTKQIYLDKQLL